MKGAVSLMYHDVVDGDLAESGFNDVGAEAYKLDLADMQSQVKALAAAASQPAVAARPDMPVNLDRAYPFFVTVDDGGVSSATYLADIFESVGWVGHFFVTTSRIGTPGFVSADQMRELHRRGHVVGSHSVSHPTQMGKCSRQQIAREWRDSVREISDILGSRADVASVPGGFYTRVVAEEAANAGIRVLFNSEPTRSVQRVQGCLVLGRYTVMRGMPEGRVLRLACNPGPSWPQWQQYLRWNSIKTVKRLMGPFYLAFRRAALK